MELSQVKSIAIPQGNVKQIAVNDTAIWSGIDSVFANNDWATIQSVFKSGNARNYWNIGDTKPITCKDGRSYTIRIVDMQIGRFELTSGIGRSNGVFEFTECIYIGSSYEFNAGYAPDGWSACDLRNSKMPQVFNNLPNDLAAVISDVKVPCKFGDSLTSGKIFLPSSDELFDPDSASLPVEDPMGRFDYKKSETNPIYVKNLIGSSDPVSYWTRTPWTVNENGWNTVDEDGRPSATVFWFTRCVSPCFAI